MGISAWRSLQPMRWTAVSATLLSSLFLATAAKRPVSVDDVMSMKQAGRAVISPDGSRVLYAVSEWEWPSGKAEPDKGDKPPELRSHVWLVPADGPTPRAPLTFSHQAEAQPGS